MNHSSDSDSIFSVTAIYSFDPGMTILGLRKHQKFRTLRQNVALSTKLQKNSQDCEKETFSKRMNKQISRELNGTSHVTGLSCVPSLLIIQPISLWVLPQEPGLYIISLLPLRLCSSSQAAILIVFLKPSFSFRLTQLLGMLSNVRFKPAHVLELASSSPRAVSPHLTMNPQ